MLAVLAAGGFFALSQPSAEAQEKKPPRVGGPPIAGPTYGRPPVTTGRNFGGYFRSGRYFSNPKVRKDPNDGDIYNYRR